MLQPRNYSSFHIPIPTQTRGLVFPCIFLMLLALRGYHLLSAMLPHIDEISLMNQLGAPFLSGGTTSSTFFPFSLVAKLLSGIADIPQLRVLTFLSDIATLFILYFGMRRLYGDLPALTAAWIFTTSWYYIYIGRLYEGAAFTPLFSVAHFLLTAHWLKSGSIRSLYGAVAVMGIGFCNHTAPWLYYAPFFWLYLLLSTEGKNLSWRNLLTAAGLLLITASPFLYVLFTVISTPQQLHGNMAYLTGFSGTTPFLVNLRNPHGFLRTFSSLFTVHHNGPPQGLRVAVSLLMFSIPVGCAIHSIPRDRSVRFFTLALVFQLGMILLSPFVPNNESQMSNLFFFFAITVSLLGYQALDWARKCSMATAALLGIFGLFFFFTKIAVMEQGQVLQRNLALARQLGSDATLFSDGAWLKVRRSPFVDGSQKEVHIVPCDSPQNFMKQGPPDRFGIIFITTECREFMAPYEAAFDVVWEGEQLIESHQRHGVIIYAKKGGPQ